MSIGILSVIPEDSANIPYSLHLHATSTVIILEGTVDLLTLDLRKHSGPTPADDMAPQTTTNCGNFTLDLNQRGFCASPLFLQTLGP